MYSHKIFLVGVLCALMMQNIVACGLADALLETAYDPQVSLSQKPDRYTQASEARFQFRCNQANCTFYCLHVQSPLFDEYEAEDLKKCNSEMAIPGLSEGEHQMLVYAQDAGDRRSEILEFIWSVDQTPPITSFASDFTTYVNTATRGLEFSCVDASPCSFNCQLENGPTSKCSSPLVLTDLTEAARLQLRIQAQDAAGNLEEVTPAQIKTIIVDNSKPVLELTDYPGKNSNGQDNRTRISVSFRTLDRGNAGPETFECQLNNEAILSNCTSPWEPTLSITSSAAQELSQTLKIRAIDGASNIGDWEQVSWVFDQIAPTVILVDQPSIVSTDRNPVFQFACTDEDCQYTCSLDGENQTLCGPPFGGPIHPIPSIALGSHGLTVTAVDLAGNRSDPIQFDWTVVSRWSEIESSGFHSCGITVDQELFCWGYNEFGQTGHNSPIQYGGTKYHEPILTPTQVGTGSNWAAVSAGYAHTCGIKTDGSLWCWGLNKLGVDTYTRLGTDAESEYVIDPHLVRGQAWEHIVVGKNFTCASKQDNTFWCWGPNTPGPTQVTIEISPSENILDIREMEASEQVCVLVDIEAGNATERRMYCSRSSFLVLDTQLNESLGGWNTVSMGSQHQCAISTENKMYCKGGNQYSQAGGETVNVVNWGTVGDKKDRWKDVAAGDVSSCAVRMDGSLWCWGAENAGLEGIASTNSKNPIQIGSQNNWESVNSSPNSRSFCAYTIAGAIYCWGDNRQGQLGFTRGDKTEPYRVTSPRATGWLNVELGENHSCALQNDGNMFCWGANQALKSLVNNSALIPHYASGQLGSKFVSQTVTATLSYLPFQTTPNIVVSRGLEYASTVQENWGLTPNWTEMSIFSQGNTVAGLQNDNDTYAWGSNQYSNLGIIESLVTNCNSPTRTEISGPVEVATLESWNQLSPGHSHSCARGNIQQNGGASLFCWGNNAYGQLGDGTSNGCRNKATSNTEVYPEGSTTNPAYWVFVSSGANFSCAIDIDNKLQCWGDNSQGQLGVENIASANTPRQVDSADDYFTASAGTTHACAINFTGQLKCWGSNEFGQVGNASQTLQATPDLITLPSSFSSDAWTYIDTGSHHSCGIIDDQFELSLWCWGSQRHGQLGISDPTDQALPVRVDKNLQWSVVSAGTDHSCGITTDGQLYCWGSNAYGKLGHGEGTIWYSSPAEFQ